MLTATRHSDASSEVPYAPLLASYRRQLETSRGLSPATVRNYLADLLPFFEYLANENVSFGRDARDLRAFVQHDGAAGVSVTYRQLIRDYVSWLVEDRRVTSGRNAGQRGHARASVVRTLAALRAFMRYLIDRHKMPDAPLWQSGSSMMRRFTPKPTRRLPDVISTREAVRLVEAPDPATTTGPKPHAAALRDRAVLELLYGGGLRVSEASGLNLGDVALASGSARVWGKGSKARMVPLGGPAIDAISAYVHEARSILAGPVASDALFLNQRGGRLTPRSVQMMVQRYAASANLRPGVHPHTLRHSFATHLLDGGADLRVVQELLGHSSPSATQVYTHISQAEARKAYMSAHPLAQKPPEIDEPASPIP
jgi:site-specific recombinase XerD